MTPWAEHQDQSGIHQIDWTQLVRRPDGEVVEVDNFNMNLARAARQTHKYIQLADGSWIRGSALMPLSHAEQRAYIGSNSRAAAA